MDKEDIIKEQKKVFNTLYSKDVSKYTEEKKGLTYLSWASAWAEVKKEYPDATYSIYRNPVTNLPYDYDANTGYMVYTSVTIREVTHKMWLPVMDYNNNAMKGEAYKINYKRSSVTVQPATMFDINKAIMRCLTKNLAMFGLGLFIYKGEDLPEKPAGEAVQEVKCSYKGCENVIEGNNKMDTQGVVKSSTKVLGKPYCLKHFYKLAKELKEKKEKQAQEKENDKEKGKVKEGQQIMFEDQLKEQIKNNKDKPNKDQYSINKSGLFEEEEKKGDK